MRRSRPPGDPDDPVADASGDASRGAERPLGLSSDGVETPLGYAKFYPPGSVEDLRFRFMRRLVVSSRRWRAHVDQHLRLAEQSQARWEALLCASAFPGGLTQGELARLLSIEDPTIGRMLAMLEAEGSISRAIDPADRRLRIVRITPEGERILATMQAVTDGLRGGILDVLTQDELETGLRILDKLLGRLEPR
ncbi:MAG: MarR family winged helix-turn-helix transcriptional regulator [Janthinobacterium lividum]